MGIGSFLAVNGPGRGVDHPPPSSAEVKERVMLLLPLWAFMAGSRVNLTFDLPLYKMGFCIRSGTDQLEGALESV